MRCRGAAAAGRTGTPHTMQSCTARFSACIGCACRGGREPARREVGRGTGALSAPLGAGHAKGTPAGSGAPSQLLPSARGGCRGCGGQGRLGRGARASTAGNGRGAAGAWPPVGAGIAPTGPRRRGHPPHPPGLALGGQGAVPGGAVAPSQQPGAGRRPGRIQALHLEQKETIACHTRARGGGVGTGGGLGAAEASARGRRLPARPRGPRSAGRGGRGHAGAGGERKGGADARRPNYNATEAGQAPGRRARAGGHGLGPSRSSPRPSRRGPPVPAPRTRLGGPAPPSLPREGGRRRRRRILGGRAAAQARPAGAAACSPVRPARGSKGLGRLLEDEASVGQRLHDVGDVLAVV